VVSPREHEAFRAVLIEKTRATPFLGGSRAPSAASWLDAIASLDGWVRALVLGAGAIATAVIAVDVASRGMLQPDGLTAMAVVFVNGIAAVAVSVRWPIAARILAGGALVAAAAALL
jgi:hypothetical protein